MTSLAPHIQRQLERYADGELSSADAQEIEALLQTHAGARAYLESIEQVRIMPQIALQDATDTIDFDALEDRIMQAVQEQAHEVPDVSPRMVSQWVDNELHDPADHQRIFAHLAEDEAARTHVEAVREIGHFTREYVRIASAQVDADRLEQHCLAPFEGTEETTAPVPQNVTPLKQWMDRFQAPLAALVGVAAATAILLPLSLGALQGDGNNKLTRIDEMNVDAGYSGTITHGTRKSAPVIWISDDEEDAATPAKEPITPMHEDDPLDEEHEDADE